MENWKQVPGYEGFYEVSDFGNVRSCERYDRRGTWHGAQLIAFNYRHKGGYVGVTLARDGVKAFFLVHNLVLLTFVGPRPDNAEARHFPNHDRRDNRISNLLWGSRSENQQDRLLQGTDQCGEQNAQCKLTTKQVEEIRSAVGSQRDIAALYGIRQQHVSRIKSGKRRSYS